MLFNNLTTGLFLAAATRRAGGAGGLHARGEGGLSDRPRALARRPACLVLDLGDPLRFHHMLRVFKPSSPMSLGTWCLTVYSLPLTVAAALSLLPDGGPTGRSGSARRPWSSALLPALGSAVYKGVLLSTNSQPGWSDARWLGGYLTNSALMLGCAEMLALSVLMGQERATAVLRTALGAAARAQRLRPVPVDRRPADPALARIYTRQAALARSGCSRSAAGRWSPCAWCSSGAALSCCSPPCCCCCWEVWRSAL